MIETNNILLDSLDQRWETYRVELKRCRVEFSEEALHDLRVATRRMLSVLDLVRSFCQPRRVQKLRRLFKNQLDGFDELRDTQVMLAEISENIQNLPELKPFQEYLQKRERRLLRGAEKHIRAIELAGISKRLLKLRASLADLPLDGLSARLFEGVDTAYLTVTQRYGWIDPDQPASIHRVRVAFKKFRYIIETIRPALPDFPEAHFKHMHAYQTLMGDIQDAEVFLENLAEFDRRGVDDARQPVFSHYRQAISRTISAYLDEMSALTEFWRPTPAADFPWQTESGQARRKKIPPTKNEEKS